MATKEVKKRELVCPHADCLYYSAEQVLVEGEWILVNYCSNPNNELIDKGASCRLYQVNWQKQVTKNGFKSALGGSNGIETIRRRRFTLLKMLRWTVNQLDPEERDTVFELVKELEQLEEQKLGLRQPGEPRKRRNSETENGRNGLPAQSIGGTFNSKSSKLGNDNHLRHTRAEEPVQSPPDPSIASTAVSEDIDDELNAFSFVEQAPETSEKETNESENRQTGEPVQSSIHPIADSSIPSLKRDPESPEGIVERFIESWNSQDFETEYNCLSKQLHTVSQDEYILSRQHAFADAMKNQNEGNIAKQRVEELVLTTVKEDFAHVECVKIEQAGRFEKEYQQSYFLTREKGKWKINKVRTSPIPKNTKRRTGETESR
jgi:hypothetical protein